VNIVSYFAIEYLGNR